MSYQYSLSSLFSSPLLQLEKLEKLSLATESGHKPKRRKMQMTNDDNLKWIPDSDSESNRLFFHWRFRMSCRPWTGIGHCSQPGFTVTIIILFHRFRHWRQCGRWFWRFVWLHFWYSLFYNMPGFIWGILHQSSGTLQLSVIGPMVWIQWVCTTYRVLMWTYWGWVWGWGFFQNFQLQLSLHFL